MSNPEDYTDAQTIAALLGYQPPEGVGPQPPELEPLVYLTPTEPRDGDVD